MSPRSTLVRWTALIAMTTSGCFALFSLEGYGPPEEATDAGPIVDATDEQRDVQEAAPPPARIVFVSSVASSGNLGGLEGADALCAVLAADAGLPGTFRAWLSDNQASPRSRFELFLDAGQGDAEAGGRALPLRMPNGQIIAAGIDDLLTSGPSGPISSTERGVTVPLGTNCYDAGDFLVWTNTNADGTRDSNAMHCNRWSIADPNETAKGGLVSPDASTWTSACQFERCNHEGRVYCFQQ